MSTSNTMASPFAGGRDSSNYCRMPWPLQIPLLCHLLAATTAPTIVKYHGHFEYYGSIICWQPQLLPLSSNTMDNSNNIALSSAGGRECSNHCQTPWPLQISCLHHLLAAATAPKNVKIHGHSNTIALSSTGGHNCSNYGNGHYTATIWTLIHMKNLQVINIQRKEENEHIRYQDYMIPTS